MPDEITKHYRLVRVSDGFFFSDDGSTSFFPDEWDEFATLEDAEAAAGYCRVLWANVEPPLGKLAVAEYEVTSRLVGTTPLDV